MNPNIYSLEKPNAQKRWFLDEWEYEVDVGNSKLTTTPCLIPFLSINDVAILRGGVNEFVTTSASTLVH